MREIEVQSGVQTGLESSETTLPWEDLIASIFRHRRLVLTIFLVGVVVATVWGWTLPPTYKASAILMVRDNRTRLAVSPDANTGALLDSGSTEEVNSLVALLTSEVLVQEILSKDDPKASDEEVPEETFLTRLLDFPNDLYRRIHHIPEPTPLEHKAMLFAQGIVVSPTPKSNILDVAYYSGSPKFSAYFANRVVEEAIGKYTRLSDTTRAQQFYRNQRELLASAVDDAQAALNQFREKIGPELLTLDRTQVHDRISTFEQSIATTTTEIAELNARMSASPESIWSDATSQDPNSGILVNPSVPAIKARLVELQIQRGELISRYAPQSAMITDIDRQIAEARRLLAQEQAHTVDIYRKDTQARIDATQARLEALQKQLAEYRDKAARLDVIAPDWERLQNELDTRRQAYQTYLRKEEEARFTNALDESQILNVTVAEPATPPHAPESSPVFKLVAIGAGLSLFLGIALAFVRDWIDPSVKSTQQAERLTGIPVLGEIPL